MWTRASTSSPTLHRQLQAPRPICAPLQCRSRAVHPGVSMRTMQARAANPNVTSRLLREFAVEGLVNIVGGCCGTTPEHIGAIGDAVRPLAARALKRDFSYREAA